MSILRWAEHAARDMLAEELPLRFEHVRQVASRAERMGTELDGEDRTVLHAAAWLHDIGYSSSLAKLGFHPLDGAKYLKLIGAPARLSGLVAFHSSSASEAEVLGLVEEMQEFRDERSLVRDLLWFADMTVGPDGRSVTFAHRMEELRTRYPAGHYVIQALGVGIHERRHAVERAERWLGSVGLAD